METSEGDKRYVIAWEQVNDREVVIVFDKHITRIVFRMKTKNHKKAYPHIIKFYGEENCVRPKQAKIAMYE